MIVTDVERKEPKSGGQGTSFWLGRMQDFVVMEWSGIMPAQECGVEAKRVFVLLEVATVIIQHLHDKVDVHV